MNNNVFTLEMLAAISPQLILSFSIVLSLLLIAWQRSKLLIQAFTLLSFIFALFASFHFAVADAIQIVQVTSLLKVDLYSHITLVLILFAACVSTIFSGQYLKKHIEVHDEYYLLLQLVILGASILVISDHFASVFLGFELLSIALVGMVGYIRNGQYSVESSFKYLILSATASSFMLLGIAYIYADSGSLSFATSAWAEVSGGLVAGIGAEITAEEVAQTNWLFTVGIILFLVGVCFKLSLVPFHFWTPDVYQGSPAPVTMLLATVSKIAMFTMLVKFWFSQPYFNHGILVNVISGIAILSMVIGNILALKQTNIKRLLGYSSIAHMGYLLIVLLVSSATSIAFAWQSTLFYLGAYVVASLSVFIVLIVYKSTSYGSDSTGTVQGSNKAEDVTIEHWQGMFWQQPLLASLTIVSMLSFAGIPLTMGFIGKFFVITHATNQQLWFLITALIIGSGIALFYYLRIVFVLFDKKKALITAPQEMNGKSTSSINIHTKVIVFSFIVLALLFGILPDLFTLWLLT